MLNTNSLIAHVEALIDEAFLSFYKEGFEIILVALKDGQLDVARNMAESMLSGYIEDLALDNQVCSILYALDGVLNRLGVGL